MRSDGSVVSYPLVTLSKNSPYPVQHIKSTKIRTAEFFLIYLLFDVLNLLMATTKIATKYATLNNANNL